MANIQTTINVPDHLLPLIQDAATESKQTVPELLAARLTNGQSVQGIASDRAQQAFWRLMQREEIPAEVLAESRAVLPKDGI